MITSELPEQARIYMKQCTDKNLAPAWELTEIAIHYGTILAPLYHQDTNKVLLALYLAHCVFSNVRGSDTMKSHTVLSSEQARTWLQDKDISDQDIDDVCKAIRLHHTTQDSGTMFYEVVKNAEGFKFLTREGILVFIHHLGERGLSYQEAKDYAICKAKQKQSYLTLDHAKLLAQDFIDQFITIY